MAEIIYNKLIRDRIPEIIEADNSVPHVVELSDEQFVQELKNKFVEEAREVQAAETKEDIISELADLAELKIALMEVHNINPESVEARRIEKALDRGGFKKKLFLKSVDTLDNKGA